MEKRKLIDRIKQQQPFPVLGQDYAAADYLHLDLSIHNPDFESRNVTTYEGLDAYVQEVLTKQRAKVGYGGYAEHRIFYQQSPLFNDGKAKPRCIHLGMDLWQAAGTPVYAPLDAQVHSFAYNDGVLDYGATIILRHELENLALYTLYGHLSRASLEGLTTGKAIARGEPFATFGTRHENGGWVPHLHFQLMLDMESKTGDYPGVATKSDAARYLENCPDPMVFFSFLP